MEPAENTLLFYDVRIDGAPDLLRGLKEEVLVQGVGPTLDPIITITRALREAEAPPASILILAHGAPGRVMLGDGIGVADLLAATENLRQWKNLMAPRPQISLFCGHVCLRDDWLIETLAELTGCAVLGASGPVGPEAFGGLWRLDRQSGGAARPVDAWRSGAPTAFRGIL